jgi:nitrite reductase/ring-hydroxylating ferredoxin subunit
MINRREFIKVSGTAVFCSCASAIGLGACSTWRDEYNVPHVPEGSYRREGKKVIISLIAANVLQEVGTAVRLRLVGSEDSQQKIIIVRSGDDAYQAFADHCTHNGKELYYLPGERIWCHSGKSQFDLEGNVIKGPVESGLFSYPLQREGDQLILEINSMGGS